MRILVVDDNTDIARLFALVLVNDGHQVDVRTDNFDALLTEDLSGYDAVSCDLMLPGITGVEILRRIREDYPAIRRVALTAAHPNDPLTEAAASVADAVLTKPSDSAAIAAAVRGQA